MLKTFESQAEAHRLFNTALASLGLASTLLISSFWITPKTYRLLPIAGALAGAGAAVASLNKRDRLLEALSDLEDIGANGRKQSWLAGTHDLSVLGSAQPEDKPKEEKLDYQVFDENRFRTDSVHLAIFASSGSGKSFFLRWLMNYKFAGDQYALIDPHADKGLTIESKEHALNLLEDFAMGRLQRLIVGAGRDFESIANFYMALEDHITWRFANGGESAGFPILNLIVEELPAIVKHTNDIEKDLVPSTNQSLLTEARKVGLRIIAVTQGDQVSLLGLKGMSSLRSAYRFVRLGKEAIKYAGQKGLSQLEQRLTDDLFKSLDLHKKTKSKAMFKGTCFMVDESEYMPFRDLRIWGTEPLESDLYDQAYTQDDPPNPPIEGHPTPPIDHADSQKNTPDFVGTGGTALPTHHAEPEAQKPRPGWGGLALVPCTPPPSYYRRAGGTPPTALPLDPPTEGGSGASMPAAKSSPVAEQKVRVEYGGDFWVEKYNSHPSFDALENVRPDFLNDGHLAKYFQLRGEGIAPSKAAKSMFSKNRYSQANVWLKETYGAVCAEGA
ncbi:hypothetical protein ACQ4N7_29230 [Nodosilinea sp. AN01ver1]|uniref:hypothetical protein n=1 Tax=Nodosilinea sp. AN01ver1 TaxID=3423362 RepID=UPI003D311341